MSGTIGIRAFTRSPYSYLGDVPLVITRHNEPYLVVKRVEGDENVGDTSLPSEAIEEVVESYVEEEDGIRYILRVEEMVEELRGI